MFSPMLGCRSGVMMGAVSSRSTRTPVLVVWAARSAGARTASWAPGPMSPHARAMAQPRVIDRPSRAAFRRVTESDMMGSPVSDQERSSHHAHPCRGRQAAPPSLLHLQPNHGDHSEDQSSIRFSSDSYRRAETHRPTPGSDLPQVVHLVRRHHEDDLVPARGEVLPSPFVRVGVREP